MEPPPAETWWADEVLRERRVAGEVFLRKGQRERDWRRRASIVVRIGNIQEELTEKST
jgi:hypothetical protein